MDGDTAAEAENATHHAFIGNSALVYPKAPERPHETATVPVIGPADLGKLDLLKIDCEGGEWTFFGRGTPDAEIIVGEVHPTNGHTPLHLVPLLSETHDVTFTGPPAGPCGFVAVRR
jgi:glyoxylase-like metal-dependent hydrolase (beta-lactamase superfamily II)